MGDAASEGRLLIVNHDPDMNSCAECVLWLNGYEPESVETIVEAEKLLRGRRYALLVCRNAMPDGSGPELMRYAWSALGIPAVAITGTLTREQMEARVSSAGLRAVILMPATQKDLLIAVAGAMGRADFVGPAHRSYVQTSEPVPCPDCRGSGYVTLLINRTRCTRCDGSGSTPPDLLDMPIRQAPLPGLARFSLYRAGVRTLRELPKLKMDEVKKRSRLSDAELKAIEAFMARSPHLDA